MRQTRRNYIFIIAMPLKCDTSPQMCDLYSVTPGQEAMRRLFRATRDSTGNLPGLPAVFPDMMAPVVRAARDGERELRMMRWDFHCRRFQCGDHERAQSEVTLPARLAQGGMALSRSGNVLLRMDRQSEGDALVRARRK
jgi:hypothetical protein